MKYPRSHHGFVKYLGKLWAIGGTDGKKPLDKVESYDPIYRKWSKELNLPFARSCGMTAVHDGAIWIIGGKDAEGNLVNSVQCYN